MRVRLRRSRARGHGRSCLLYCALNCEQASPSLSLAIAISLARQHLPSCSACSAAFCRNSLSGRLVTGGHGRSRSHRHSRLCRQPVGTDCRCGVRAVRRHEGPREGIEGTQPAACSMFRHVAAVARLREALGPGRLSHAGTQERRREQNLNRAQCPDLDAGSLDPWRAREQSRSPLCACDRACALARWMRCTGCDWLESSHLPSHGSAKLERAPFERPRPLAHSAQACICIRPRSSKSKRAAESTPVAE